MAAIAADLGFGIRQLYRKLDGETLTLADMRKIREVSGDRVTFDDYIEAAAE